MHTVTHMVDIELAAHAAFRQRRACGWQLTCLEGQVWISVGGQAEDIFLNAGESRIVTGKGLLIAEGLGPARLRLEAPAGMTDRLWRTCLRILRRGPAPSGASFPA